MALTRGGPEHGIWGGIGIASAGVINCERKSIVYASNLGWHNAEVGSVLKERFNVPVRLGNDANMAAVAEYVWGTKKEVQSLIYITVSTGIGAGIINGGQLLQGESMRDQVTIQKSTFGKEIGVLGATGIFFMNEVSS